MIVKAKDQVRHKKPGLKFSSVLDGTVLSIDASDEKNPKATVAFEDNSVAKVPMAELTLKTSSIVRAQAASSSFASKLGF
jgi:hypothetical protein